MPWRENRSPPRLSIPAPRFESELKKVHVTGGLPDNDLLQSVKRFRITEKAGDIDEQILIQSIDFIANSMKQGYVLARRPVPRRRDRPGERSQNSYDSHG